MPTNKNALIRYKYLDKLLSDYHHFYDIHDLTEKVNDMLYEDGFPEVTQRCIEKDINTLEYAPFSAPIERFNKNGKRCIHYENRSFSIFKKEISREEQNLLREVLSTIGQFDGLDNFGWLEDFKIGLHIEERRQIISFANNPYLQNSNLLGTLFDNISNEVVIRLSYHTFNDETIRSINSVKNEGIEETMVVVPLRVGFQTSRSQMFVKSDDVQVGDVLEFRNLSPASEELHESGVAFLAVFGFAILSDFHSLITEIKKVDVARPQSFQPVWNSEDVDATLGHHVDNDLSHINHQLLQCLVQLDSINAVSYCTTVPLLRKEPDARSHILLLSFESNSQLNCCFFCGRSRLVSVVHKFY